MLNKDDYKELGRQDIDLLAVHKGRGQRSANDEILNYDGMTYSITKFDPIKSIEENVYGRKVKNSDKLRQWINVSLHLKHFQV